MIDAGCVLKESLPTVEDVVGGTTIQQHGVLKLCFTLYRRQGCAEVGLYAFRLRCSGLRCWSFLALVPTATAFALLFHQLPDYLLLPFTSIEGIGDLGHDLGVGDPPIWSDGRYEVGAVGKEVVLAA